VGTALTLTYSVAPAAYYNGQRFAFQTNTAVTGSCTLNVNALGAKTIKKVYAGSLTNLSSGDIPAASFLEVAYNTANDCFVWVNSLGSIILDSSGSVGIGKAPSEKLHVLGNAYIQGTANATFYLRNLSSVNRIDSYDYPVTTTYPLLVNASDLKFQIADTARLQIDSSGNVLNISSGGLGYGTGSGGTVTQITSKATGVTLNKTNGTITMNGAALAATTTVAFQVLNSTVAATDVIIIHRNSGGTANSYNIWIDQMAGGAFQVCVRNITGGSLSEAVVLTFAVIKAVAA
jgi:hypothetical protein